MKLVRFTLIGMLVALAGCQTLDPNSPEALKRKEYDRLLLNTTMANCKLIVQLNQKRVSQNKEPTRDNNCARILKNHALGGVHPASFIPDLAVNGIPIPIGGLIKLAIVADRNQREKKAWEASLPTWVSAGGENSENVYRMLLTQGFKPEELEGLKGSAGFSDAVRAVGPFVQFSEANPDVVRKANAG